MAIHALFDGFAWLATALTAWLLRRHAAELFPMSGRPPTGYLLAVVCGAAIGAYLLGSVNVWLAGQAGLARSIEGALAGAILAVELYKWRTGLTGRTAALFALPVAIGIGVGRIGCYLSGLEDFTYGVPTDLPWGHDFGDGVLRHPVQLYESGAMALFALGYLVALARRQAWVLHNGFALFVLFYAVQRFGLEVLKPYPAVALGLTVFQIVSLVMILYALAMLRPRETPMLSPPDLAPVRKSRPYIFYGETTSLCDDCLALVPAKIEIRDGEVWYEKRCHIHGVQKALISTDVPFYKWQRDFLKPGDRPNEFQARTDYGCPYDCGLCPDHEQHSCLALIEINQHCNLSCPVCFAGSSPQRTEHLPLATIEKMLDALVASEGEPDLLQISGGEPTIHPQILEVIDAAKARPIRHLMLNTNGIRIAQDPDFVAALAERKAGFEVYLQFDSLEREALLDLRGADLRRIRQEALEALERHGISTTLVATLKKGVNDHEVKAIIDHALGWSCVRGVTFQPIEDVGRNDNFDARRNRLTLSEVRRRIIDDHGLFGEADMIPLPCNPDAITIGYGLRNGRTVAPVTSMIPRDMLLEAVPNSVAFERYPELKRRIFELFSLSVGESTISDKMTALLCCLPEVPVPEGLDYGSIFRVAVISFMDRHNFSVPAAKRSCIHFVTPNGQIIPFETYNLFYRNGEIGPIRARLDRQREVV